jgi:hypothetical protein
LVLGINVIIKYEEGPILELGNFEIGKNPLAVAGVVTSKTAGWARGHKLLVITQQQEMADNINPSL